MRRSMLLVVLLTLGVYANLFLSGDTEFVFDDKRFILENAAVHDLSRAAEYFTDPTTVDPMAWTGIYRPLRTLDFAIDWAIAGASPRWFHFRNALYHALGAILVLLLLRRWGAGTTAATFGALVFALHPVQVEAAGWITSRGDLLCLVFFLLAILLHQGSRGYDLRFAGAAGLLVLALLSKEAAVMFPAAVFLADFFFRDERRFSKTFARWPKYAVYLLLAALYFGLWTWLHEAREAPKWHVSVRWGDTFFGTLLTMSRGFVYYFRCLLLPFDMATDFYVRPVTTPDPLTLLSAAVVLVVFGWAVYRLFRGGGALAFGVLWFFVTMFPTSNLPAPIGITTADRFLNLPMAGLALAAGLLLARFFRREGAGRGLAVTIVACLALVSFDRALAWESERALWTATLDRFMSPRALEWRADQTRAKAADLKADAEALERENRTAAAEGLRERAKGLLEQSERDIERLIEAWRRLPASDAAVRVARSYRAFTWYVMGRIEEALAEADYVVEQPVPQALGRAFLVRALALHDQGHHRAAARAAEEALVWWNKPTTRHRAATIYQDLARWYQGKENHAKAYAAMRRAWELLPDPVLNAGVREAIHSYEERYEEILGRLRAAVEANPGDAGAWLDLATTLAISGDWDDAGRLFDQLLARAGGREPWLLLPYARWQWEARDTLEGYARAAELYQEVLAADPDNAEALAGISRVARERTALLQSHAR